MLFTSRIYTYKTRFRWFVILLLLSLCRSLFARYRSLFSIVLSSSYFLALFDGRYFRILIETSVTLVFSFFYARETDTYDHIKYDKNCDSGYLSPSRSLRLMLFLLQLGVRWLFCAILCLLILLIIFILPFAVRLATNKIEFCLLSSRNVPTELLLSTYDDSDNRQPTTTITAVVNE